MQRSSHQRRAERSLVSVLTPSFQQAAYLGDCLDSVACQSYDAIEHIVCDGGSDDGSVEALASRGDAVRWVSEPDGGQSSALNKAFRMSRGEIIGWLNSDDAYFDRDVVADVARVFEQRPGVDVVYGHSAHVTADGKVVDFVWTPPFTYRGLQMIDYLSQPAVFVRRSAVGDPFVDESFGFAMDWELWLRLGQRCRFARIDRVVAIDRIQPERKTKTWLDVYHEDHDRLAGMYGVFEPWYYPAICRAHYLSTRLGGVRFVPGMPRELAFSGEQDDRRTLLLRQALSRRSRWPEEYR